MYFDSGSENRLPVHWFQCEVDGPRVQQPFLYWTKRKGNKLIFRQIWPDSWDVGLKCNGLHRFEPYFWDFKGIWMKGVKGAWILMLVLPVPIFSLLAPTKRCAKGTQLSQFSSFFNQFLHLMILQRWRALLCTVTNQRFKLQLNKQEVAACLSVADLRDFWLFLYLCRSVSSDLGCKCRRCRLFCWLSTCVNEGVFLVSAQQSYEILASAGRCRLFCLFVIVDSSEWWCVLYLCRPVLWDLGRCGKM